MPRPGGLYGGINLSGSESAAASIPMAPVSEDSNPKASTNTAVVSASVATSTPAPSAPSTFNLSGLVNLWDHGSPLNVCYIQPGLQP